MTERAAYFNIALDDVSITSLTFGREFTSAIEAKQIAAQEAERAKFVVEKAEQDKLSAILRAQVKNLHLHAISSISLLLFLLVLLSTHFPLYSIECLFSRFASRVRLRVLS